jgi:hypothetical protein
MPSIPITDIRAADIDNKKTYFADTFDTAIYPSITPSKMTQSTNRPQHHRTPSFNGALLGAASPRKSSAGSLSDDEYHIRKATHGSNFKLARPNAIRAFAPGFRDSHASSETEFSFAADDSKTQNEEKTVVDDSLTDAPSEGSPVHSISVHIEDESGSTRLALGVDESGRPSNQGRLLLVSLLENFCDLYDQDPDKNRRLFLALCRRLSSMGVSSRV